MNAMEWIDLDNDPAPQWVGDIAMREGHQYQELTPYIPSLWESFGPLFKALCRRIYRTETPPVDPDFERMERAIAAYGNVDLSDDILSGVYHQRIQAALNAWNETVAS